MKIFMQKIAFLTFQNLKLHNQKHKIKSMIITFGWEAGVYAVKTESQLLMKYANIKLSKYLSSICTVFKAEGYKTRHLVELLFHAI